MSEDSFSIVRLTEELLPKVHALFAEARNLHFPEGYFLRKYGSNPPHLRFVCLLALDQNRAPAGFVAIVARPLKLGDNTFLGGEFLDVVTHPKHRGKGLFVQLSQQVVALGQSLGMELLFSTPNDQSGPIMVHKLGWKLHETLVRFEYLSPSPDWYRYATRFAWTRGVYFNQIEHRLKPYLLPNAYPKGAGNQKGGVVWDSVFFKSKQTEKNRFIRFEDWHWWFRFDGGLFVADVRPATERARSENFPAALRSLTRSLGIKRVFGYFPKDSYAASCFAQVADPNPGVGLYIYPLTERATKGAWEFSLADCDSF